MHSQFTGFVWVLIPQYGLGSTLENRGGIAIHLLRLRLAHWPQPYRLPLSSSPPMQNTTKQYSVLCPCFWLPSAIHHPTEHSPASSTHRDITRAEITTQYHANFNSSSSTRVPLTQDKPHLLLRSATNTISIIPALFSCSPIQDVGAQSSLEILSSRIRSVQDHTHPSPPTPYRSKAHQGSPDGSIQHEMHCVRRIYLQRS